MKLIYDLAAGIAAAYVRVNRAVMKPTYVAAAAFTAACVLVNLSRPLYGLALAGMGISMATFPYWLGKLLLARALDTMTVRLWVRVVACFVLLFGTVTVIYADWLDSVPLALGTAALVVTLAGAVMAGLARGEVARERIFQEELRGRETTGTDVAFWSMVHAEKETDG